LPNPVLFIDALNIFTQQYCANSALGSNSEPIGAIVGTLAHIKNLSSIIFPKKIFFVLEGENGATKKKSIFKEYKNHRKPPKLNRFYDAEDLPLDSEKNKNWQMLILLELLKLTPICPLCINDSEADDVIGWACRSRFLNEEKIISSNDRDFYQLLDDKTKIYLPSKKILIRKDDVIKEFFVSVENFLVAKAICGDNSDNINGIEGVGFKSLAKRIPILAENKERTLSDVLDFCSEQIKNKKSQKIYSNIIENKSILFRNFKLMRLDVMNLSDAQIRKTNYVIDNFEFQRKKLEFHKILIKSGIYNFNTEDFWISLNSISNQ